MTFLFYSYSARCVASLCTRILFASISLHFRDYKLCFRSGICPIGFRSDLHSPPCSHAQRPWLKGFLKSSRISPYKALYLAHSQRRKPLQPPRIVSASSRPLSKKKKIISQCDLAILNLTDCPKGKR